MERDNYGIMEGYNNLLVAVVKQAAIDYRRALKRLIRKPGDPESRQMVDECERFFRRDMGNYVNLDGEKVIAAPAREGLQGDGDMPLKDAFSQYQRNRREIALIDAALARLESQADEVAIVPRQE
ncbi:MAG: hypothetical protein ACLTLQ_17990 [[Clostridium] scindens]